MLDVRNIKNTQIHSAANFGDFKCPGKCCTSLCYNGSENAQSVNIFLVPVY